MTGARVLSLASPLVVGAALLGLGHSLGGPVARVAWAAPAIAIAVTALIVRAGTLEGARRDGLAVVAAAAFLACSGIGIYALAQVVRWAWITANASGQLGSSAFLSSLAASWDVSWDEHFLAMTSWIAMAVVPVIAAMPLAVPVIKKWLTPSREVENGPWAARWMTTTEAGYLARQRDGLPLGRLNGRLLRFKLSPGWRGGHHMLIAGTRAGKGVSGVLPAIIDHAGPLVAIDVKGELAAVTQRWRRSLGQHVVVLDPLGVVGPSVDRFNPLDYVRRDPAYIARDAEVIAEGLVKPEGGDGEHFSVMARNLIAAAIEVVVKVAEPDARNLITVADMLGPNVVATLEAWQDSAEVVGKAAARVAAAILNTGDKERGSILTTVSKAFAWTSSEPMEKFLEASDFQLDELIDGKADIFFVVPLDQVNALSVFLRLMVNIVAGVAIREMGKRNLAKPLLLVADEFTRLGRMPKLLDIATVAAGAGVECLFIAQDRAQVASVYRDGEADTLLAACATVRVWGLGRTDNATAQWVVSGIGDRTVQTHSKPLDGKTKGSESEQRSKLLTPDELLELPASDMVALFPGRPPLRLKRIISHDDPDYRDKLDPNPTLRL